MKHLEGPLAPLMGGTSHTTSEYDGVVRVDGLEENALGSLRWVIFHVPAGVDPADVQNTYCGHDRSRNDAGIWLAENIRERRPVAFYHPNDPAPHPVHRSKVAQIRDPEAPIATLDDVDDVADICSICGETETVELHDVDLDGREQSITVCAGCGSDER